MLIWPLGCNYCGLTATLIYCKACHVTGVSFGRSDGSNRKDQVDIVCIL